VWLHLSQVKLLAELLLPFACLHISQQQQQQQQHDNSMVWIIDREAKRGMKRRRGREKGNN